MKTSALMCSITDLLKVKWATFLGNVVVTILRVIPLYILSDYDEQKVIR